MINSQGYRSETGKKPLPEFRRQRFERTRFSFSQASESTLVSLAMRLVCSGMLTFYVVKVAPDEVIP